MRDKGNWEIINRKRKKWKEINKRTEMREWEEYFKELLGGDRKKSNKRKKRKEEARDRKGVK